ncbi:MAG: hypothetical protein ACREGD_04665 [Candidatus Saccharimonadales bacterium]
MSKKRLVVFLVPPEKIVNGGVLSIFSICKESRAFRKIHRAEVVLATYPGYETYRKNDLFKNDETIYSFDEIVKRGVPDFLLLHVPEYASLDVFQRLNKDYLAYIHAVADLRINIMHQNVLLMQKPHEVANWFAFTPNVTQTTAHNKYTSQELADKYNLPTRHLSTFVDARQYQWTPYQKKKKIIALSPDVTEKREHIVAKLEKELPDYEVITIRNLSYEQYKKFIATAKYVITFGEGFDGYYVEGFFTGGITFAVYNNEFFPNKEFGTFENTFSSFQDMLNGIVKKIQALDKNQKQYEKINKSNLDKINQLYNFANYQENIKKFYSGEYSFIPRPLSAEQLLGEVIRQQDEAVAKTNAMILEKDKAIAGMEKIIADKLTTIRQLDEKIIGMEHSHSWKITKPLRKAAAIVKKKK